MTTPNRNRSERLAILQGADTERRWHSLDDERICVLCHRLISGHDIRISERIDGQHELHCPTDGCHSTPGDWFYHGSAPAAPGRPPLEPPGKVEIDLNLL